ncbi:glycosyltransferase family 2 protein [Mycoplasmopsis mucosicanis]|uniref:Glycosyltransferase family 2 protein n=1 Tax=Mycoplasmopsis mucosicanis TaxID=458208 RepID=A0A507SPL3_9BACT|nr:glycosyltransferase family 2 protein [Mycoplasmopsis mucosicanis]TQC51288.1 glycosyltransferase family 2 protein [Mycoplasmopsis mucosicanis]
MQNKIKVNYLPKISILVPTHNSIGRFEKTINKILSQTYKNLEIIFHDDGSSDNTLQILQKIASLDKRVKVLNSHINIGLASSRNNLINAASGDFIFFIDDDDYFTSDKVIEKCVKVLSPQTQIMATEFYYAFAPGIKFLNPLAKLKTKNIDSLEYYLNSTTFAWGSFINLEFFRSLNISFTECKNVFEDISTMGKIFASCKNFTYTNIRTIIYNRYKSIMSAIDKNIIQKMETVERSFVHIKEFFASKLSNDKEKYLRIEQSLYMEHLSLLSLYYAGIKNRQTKANVRQYLLNNMPRIHELYPNSTPKRTNITQNFIFLNSKIFLPQDFKKQRFSKSDKYTLYDF